MASKPTTGSILIASISKILLESLLVLGLLLGCTSPPQIYSTTQHEALALDGPDLRQGGLAILTPDTVLTRNEDKQSLALVVADVLKQERPDIRCLGLPETLNRINHADLSNEYRQMRVNYQESGLFPKPLLQQIGKAIGTRYVVQLKLAGFEQSFDTRLSIFGLRLLATKYANMRLFMQIWDTETATIAWEGLEESNYAFDTGTEKSIPFKTIVEETTRSLIVRLPGSSSTSPQGVSDTP